MAIGKSTTYKGIKYNLSDRERAIVDLAQESTLTFDKAVSFTGTLTAGTGLVATTGGVTASAGGITASYAAESDLGILGTHRRKVFGSQANGQTVHLSASGGTILQSTDDAIITLPATRAGLQYTFIHAGAATEQFDLSPNASDKIMGSCIDSNAINTVVEGASNGAGVDNKDLTLDGGSGVGDRVTIVADGADGWYITECMGSFAVES
tara:strand:+ start:160 stop:786 length:627 start_codon:yes stop_codon:yes gene_type:complete